MADVKQMAGNRQEEKNAHYQNGNHFLNQEAAEKCYNDLADTLKHSSPIVMED